MEDEVWVYCKFLGIIFVYKVVDICVVEFEVFIFYYYFIYELEECEVLLLDKFKVMILGGGFNCIG